MKNRNSIYKNLQGVSMGIMAACLALTGHHPARRFCRAGQHGRGLCHARSEID